MLPAVDNQPRAAYSSAPISPIIKPALATNPPDAQVLPVYVFDPRTYALTPYGDLKTGAFRWACTPTRSRLAAGLFSVAPYPLDCTPLCKQPMLCASSLLSIRSNGGAYLLQQNAWLAHSQPLPLKCPPPFSQPRAAFLLESVLDLKARLKAEVGSDLLVLTGKPEELIPGGSGAGRLLGRHRGAACPRAASSMCHVLIAHCRLHTARALLRPSRWPNGRLEGTNSRPGACFFVCVWLQALHCASCTVHCCLVRPSPTPVPRLPPLPHQACCEAAQRPW